MFYVYNDRTARLSDPYTTPGNIQIIPHKNNSVDAILKRTKKDLFYNCRTPVYDVKNSHYYKEVGGVRTPKELYRALKQLGAKTTQAEASTIFRAYPDNFGGFDFRRFGDQLVCGNSDRRKTKRLDRVLVPDSRRTNVYAIRSLPPSSAQSQLHQNEADNAGVRRDALTRSVTTDHPLHPNGKKFIAAGEVNSKLQFPHSLPNARVDMHEALQRYPRSANADHQLRTHRDPITATARGFGQPDSGFHVSSKPARIRPKTSAYVSETDRALGRSGRQVRPATAANQPFSNARSYSGRGLSATGKDFHPSVSRGLWSHSPIPEVAQGRRVRKHHPSSHKLAQLHHMAYRPMSHKLTAGMA